jgi:glutamate synthase (NADPH/NADH) large chain/glutamate synthase (ferredoxin)
MNPTPRQLLAPDPGIPIQSGSLHRPELERDACGVGVVADINGVRNNRILEHGIISVCNVIHRGAQESDMKTGDGAGVTTQLPYDILLPEVERLGGSVESPEQLAVGVFFLPAKDHPDHVKAKIIAEGVVRNRGIEIIGWREVPVNPRELGDQARETQPEILHLLLKRPDSIVDGDAFERVLYLVRREIEIKSKQEDISRLYISSMSHRLISYKAFLVATALQKFYLDLQNPEYKTAICLYHQRFSTNTFPTWSLAQPFRMLAHNGEINTLRGNRNWLNSRVAQFDSEAWGDDVKLLHELIDPTSSDSASLDNALELLVLSGRSLQHAMTMLVPSAWRIDPFTSPKVEEFYKYHSCFSEPWDGPAALAFTDGKSVAACLDRNGLRPARYKITDDGLFVLGSEVGTSFVDDATVIEKGRLAPGEIILVDLEKGSVTHDREIKEQLAARKPYGEWMNRQRIRFVEEVDPTPPSPADDLDILGLTQKQVAFGYNKEEMDMAIAPMVRDAQEAVYSMGDDAALSVLSLKPKLLYTYFKQLFAQVTNPPIDPIREHLVMSVEADIGPERNLLTETEDHARVIHLKSPFLFTHQLEALKTISDDFPAATLDMTWVASEGPDALEVAVERLCDEAEAAVDNGARLLILSDRATDHERVAIPALMATGAVHHHLARRRKRMLTSLIIDTGEARETHQMACLIGFGGTAICPYLAHDSVREMVENDPKDTLGGISLPEALLRYHKGLEKGVLKIMSKMGISVLNSYQGAQIFEAVGLGSELIGRCFKGTPSQIEGVGFREIAIESLARHESAYASAIPDTEASSAADLKLDDPGHYRYRRNGEVHSVTGPVIKNFHTFVKSGDPEDYDDYVQAVLENRPVALHDLFELVPHERGPILVDEVEPVEDIRRRFTTAAMSMGAISPEAHETLAIAMNRIGGKSDSGEGGEDPRRFKPYPNGDWANSKIKQIASGRFGVSAEYLASAEELEIKMAQGAKPGEGGQLPGHKVNGIIAKLRNTQPGVTLISPPPHHDIYSIEDLAQLIYDLKQVNPRARVCVKLVAETGVGTIAAGVAKANADIILVSGHDGGTGASPLSSIKNAGLPWEIGVAETQQVLMMNGLRDRVTLRTDGGMRTGMDIIHAAILGAEEFNFGTIALIAMGCVYVRRCHLNNCPVGVATTDPKYRAKFKGEVEHVVNFFNAVSEETREIMATLGVRRLDDLIGKPKFLKQRHVPDHPKANTLDLSKILHDVAAEAGEDLPRICRIDRNDGVHAHPLDDKIIHAARSAIRDKQPVSLEYKVKNTNRNIGTKLSGEVAGVHGNHGLPEGTIDVKLRGSAGQSFGTFLAGGIRLTLTGEANDYVGKGMCGGEIIIRPNAERKFTAGDNSIMGNTVMYGATGDHLFANGQAGERFCVRNSGGTAVVEGIGDHGCEYMTNGTVLILGSTGKNFGAGMSGGVAFVLDLEDKFSKLYNDEMIEIVPLDVEADINLVKSLIYSHLESTDSERAKEILSDWETYRKKFHKVQTRSGIAVPHKSDETDAKKDALAKKS